MRCIVDTSLAEIPVRRAISDPTVTPRESHHNYHQRPPQHNLSSIPQQQQQGHHHNRVGTPYPLLPPTKKEFGPSRIPRLTGQYSHTVAYNRSKFTATKRRGVGLVKPPSVLKTKFYPTASHPSCSSTTTLQYPRDLTFTASGEESQVDLHCHLPVSPPLVQLFKKSPRARRTPSIVKTGGYLQPSQQQTQQNHYNNNNQDFYNNNKNTSPNKVLVICNGVEKLSSAQSTSSNQPGGGGGYNTNINPGSTPSTNKSSRNTGLSLNREGYLKGSEGTNNQNRFDIYGKSTNFEVFSCNQDRGDYSLPPLPPNVKNKHSNSLKIRLATATLSQGNTILEPHLLCQNNNENISNSSSSCGNNTTNNNNNNTNNSGYPSRSSIRSGQYTSGPAKQHSNHTNLCNHNSNFNRSNNFSSTSLSKTVNSVHLAESCTNLHQKLHSEPEPEIQNNHTKCPLCVESKSHLHHRTMCSRYMTDLEWRICHAVNIYVYKNGEEGQTPVLIHIPPSKKKNMRCVMSVIQERICYPIGYAKHLYRMNGKKVTNPCELEMYNNYVVASNYDKAFKCVCYARRKSPLLVLAKESKHVRELRLKNFQYELYLANKRRAEESNCVYGNNCNNSFYACDLSGQSGTRFGPASNVDMSMGYQTNARASGQVFSGCNSSRKKQRSVIIPFTQVSSRNFDQQQSPRTGTFDQQQQQLQQPQQQISRSQGIPFDKQSYNQNAGGVPLQNPVPNGRPVSSNVVLPLNEIMSRDYNPQNPIMYTVNTCTISTAPLKDPNDILKKNKDPEEVGDGLASQRYKGIINDEESVFYSCKKKKINRGVIDLSGEKKKIFYRESDILNANIGDSDMDDAHHRRGHCQKYDSYAYSTEEQSESELQHRQKFKQIKTVNVELPKQQQKDPSLHFQKDMIHHNANMNKLMIHGNGNILTSIGTNRHDNDSSNKREEQASLAVGNGDELRGKGMSTKMETIGGSEGKNDLSIPLAHDEDVVESVEGNQAQDEVEDDNDRLRMNNNEQLGQDMNNKDVGKQQQNNNECTITTNATNNNTFSNFIHSNNDGRETCVVETNNNNNPISGENNNDNVSISAPSRSYTVLGTSTPGQNRHTQVTPAHPQSSQFENNKSNGNNKVDKFGAGVSSTTDNNNNGGQFHPNLGYNMYNTSQPSLYMSRNQTTYGPCFGASSYYVQPTTAKYQQQQHLQQIYPLEIVNQRPSPYHHHLGLENSAMRGFRPQESPSFANCYSADEIDIPFTPLYQRNVTIDPRPYMQVPSFVTTNSQFGYRGDLQPHYVPSRMGHTVSPLKKPSRRNVAIQMGEPSTLESPSSTNTTNSPSPCMTFEPQVCTPRQPQQIFYPNYYYTTTTANNQTNVLQTIPANQQQQQFSTSSSSSSSGNANSMNSSNCKNNILKVYPPTQQISNASNNPQQQQEGMNDSTVLPPPTRFKDNQLFEHKSSRPFCKSHNNSSNNNSSNNICSSGNNINHHHRTYDGRGLQKEETLIPNNENDEFYNPPISDTRHTRCAWKKT